MARTEVRSRQIKDQEVKRDDLNTTISGQSVITRLLPGTGVSFDSSTGADSGTGDVTISSGTPVSLTTSNGTPQVLATITPSGNSVTWFEIDLSARLDDTGTNKSYWAFIRGAVRRNNSGAAVVVGTALIFDDSENAAYVASIDVSGNDLRILVQGAASETVKWKGLVRYQEAI